MAIPQAHEAQPFYRTSKQRFEDATGSIYLAGYSVECILKALLLNSTPRARRAEVLLNFRGQRGHDLEWLRAEYLSAASSSLPADVAEHFARVNREWGTDRRYESGLREKREAKAFLESAQRIIEWADGRMSMPKSERNDRSIPEIAQILDLLESEYKAKHPEAEIDVYRRNHVSIRIRVIDPDFRNLDSIERDEMIWKILRQLPDQVRSNITLLILVTPEEQATSFANLEFENPLPSRL